MHILSHMFEHACRLQTLLLLCAQNVEGSALVSKGEKSIGQRALRLKLPISQVIDELNEVKAQLAQKEQEIQHLKMEQVMEIISMNIHMRACIIFLFHHVEFFYLFEPVVP